MLVICCSHAFCAPWENVEVIPGKSAITEAKKKHEKEIKEVVVYVSLYCKECLKVMNFFKNRKIPYTKKMVIDTSYALGTLIDISNTPLTVFKFKDGSEKKVHGYDEAMLLDIIKEEERLKKDSSGFDLRQDAGDSFDLR
ncbi:MAG: hypothetical protein D6808_00510 [Candidatus Dadabacteria bacterium]|nr:MAG: hypothetical protein D6808_00510 [Candidatus Dadabacteria bacterium]